MKILVPINEKDRFIACCDGCIADDGCFDLCDPIQKLMQVDCESERVIFKIVEDKELTK